MQDTPTYEEALKLLVDTHEGEEVAADRDLFELGAQYRKNWKSVYGGAERFYVPDREDGTVGKGVYQQWLHLSERRGVLRWFCSGATSEDGTSGSRWRWSAEGTGARETTWRDTLWFVSASKAGR